MSVGDHLANGNVLNNTLMFATSLTGSPNNVPTEAGANDPGLEPETNGTSGGNLMRKHWLWIVGIILLVLLGLWYYGGSSSAASA